MIEGERKMSPALSAFPGHFGIGQDRHRWSHEQWRASRYGRFTEAAQEELGGFVRLVGAAGGRFHPLLKLPDKFPETERVGLRHDRREQFIRARLHRDAQIQVLVLAIRAVGQHLRTEQRRAFHRLRHRIGENLKG